MSSNLKVTLVLPRLKYMTGDPPLGLAYIASYLRVNANADVNILDATFHQSHEYIRSSIEEKMPDVLGIFTDTLMFNDAIRIAEYARDCGIFVVMGGPHVTILPETVIEKINVAIIGEGEHTFAEVVKKFRSEDIESVEGIWFNKNGNIIKNPRRNNDNTYLDELPFPAFDLLDMNKYVKYWSYLDCVNTGLTGVTMITSRGCPYKCAYCQPTLDTIFGKKLRRRSPRNVIDEMKHLKNEYDINGIFFHDDTLTVDKKWLMEFSGLLKKEKLDLLWGCNSRINTVDEEMMRVMYRSGLRNIHFGIESGSQRILDNIYQKAIKLDDVKRVLNTAKRVGIYTLGFFMLGAPTETQEEIESTIRLSLSLDLDEATFSIATPLIGTYLYDMVKNDSKYTLSKDFSDFDYYKKRAFIDDDLTYSKLRYFQRKALFSFYTHPRRWRYVLRHLFSLKGLLKIFNKLRRFF